MTIARLHPQLKLTRTLTGRLATSGFPVLGLPKSSEFRGLVRAPKGFSIYEADYSQIELRTAAELSQCDVLIDVYVRGEDLHAKTAHEVLGAPKEKDKQDEVTQRRPAKVGNFSMLMGTTPSGLTASVHAAGNLEWSKNCPGCKSWKAKHVNCDSEKFMDGFFRTFPGVRQFMNDRREHALKTGKAYGMWGMEWYLPGAWSPHEEVREATLRQSHALPVQEGAQRLIKQAMAAVSSKDLPWAAKRKARVEPILQIHDSLVFLVETDFAKEWHERVTKTMSTIVKWAVPIEADGKFGPTWKEMSKL